MIDFRIVILFFVGLAFYYVLIRVVRKGTAREARFGAILVAPVVALFGGAEALHTKPQSRPFRSALSEESFDEVRAWLTGLKPGDPVDISFGTAPHPTTDKSIPLADGWIGDYSGRYLNGNDQFGHPTALEGNTLHGNHLFGYLTGYHGLRPAVLLVTRAQAAWDLTPEEADSRGYEEMETIVVDGAARPLYIKEIAIHEVVPMEEDWPVDPELAELELSEKTAQVEAVFKEPLTPERFALAERKLAELPNGCDRWDMMNRMGGRLITLLGFDAVMCMDGYLNFTGIHRWAKTTPEGIFLAQPFGILKGQKEIPKLVALFLNNRLHKVLPYSPREEMEKELGI